MKTKKVISAMLSMYLTCSAISGAYASAAEKPTEPKLFAASERAQHCAAKSNLDSAFAGVGALPASFDLRKEGLTPAVRNQGLYGRSGQAVCSRGKIFRQCRLSYPVRICLSLG